MNKAFMAAVSEALARNATGNELVQIIIEHRDAGLTQQDAHDGLRALREPIRVAFGEEVEDRILELMDIVVGFCSPNHRLWKDQLQT